MGSPNLGATHGPSGWPILGQGAGAQPPPSSWRRGKGGTLGPARLGAAAAPYPYIKGGMGAPPPNLSRLLPPTSAPPLLPRARLGEALPEFFSTTTTTPSCCWRSRSSTSSAASSGSRNGDFIDCMCD